MSLFFAVLCLKIDEPLSTDPFNGAGVKLNNKSKTG